MPVGQPRSPEGLTVASEPRSVVLAHRNQPTVHLSNSPAMLAVRSGPVGCKTMLGPVALLAVWKIHENGFKNSCLAGPPD